MKTLPPGIRISAIVPTEEELERLVSELTEKVVNRHEISIQGSPERLEAVFGKPFIDPHIIQHSQKSPTREPFLMDDFGFVLGFAFAIPFILGIILGVFVYGNIFSVSDNIVYGTLGGLIGAIPGAALAFFLNLHRKNMAKKQEREGGFVVWIEVDSEDKMRDILPFLRKYHAGSIESTVHK
jgi:hypothetical protein